MSFEVALFEYDHYSGPHNNFRHYIEVIPFSFLIKMLIKRCRATYKLRVQVAGQPMHPRRVLDDPVKEISQRHELAASMSVGTDWHGAHAGTQVQAQKCH